MGGYIVIRYSIEKGDSLQFEGVIATSPALKHAFPINPVKYWVGRWASYLLPSKTIASALDFNQLSRKKEVVEAANKDPLICHRVSLQSGTKQSISICRSFIIARVMIDGQTTLREMTTPKIAVSFLIAHGSSDKIIRSFALV
jgi:alpha-beta hydrolase superfamily lysophospholipase